MLWTPSHGPRIGWASTLTWPSRFEEEVTEATSTEILERWESSPGRADRAAEVVGPLWREGAPRTIIMVYTVVATDSGVRTDLTEHVLLHELAHVLVGQWPNFVDGRFVFQPDRHGPLFTRRHLDFVERFHPECHPDLIDAYSDLDVEVAPPDAEPASW